MSANTRNSLEGLRVLVVEDERVLAELMGEILRNLDCIVIGPAASVSEALAAIHANEIDAALLDIQLDGTTVYPAAEELKHRNIPFVLTSGHGNLDTLPQLLRDAPRLTKPFNVQQLVNILTSSALPRDRGQPHQS